MVFIHYAVFAQIQVIYEDVANGTAAEILDIVNGDYVVFECAVCYALDHEIFGHDDFEVFRLGNLEIHAFGLYEFQVEANVCALYGIYL